MGVPGVIHILRHQNLGKVAHRCVQVSLYNVKANGKRDYLSIGEDMLPTVFMVRSIQ